MPARQLQATPKGEKNSPASQPCTCGSGLRALSCCKMQQARRPTAAAQQHWGPSLAKAQEAYLRKDFDEATSIVTDILEHFPTFVSALLLLYKIHADKDNVQAAQALLTRAVKIDPNKIQPTLELTQLLLRKGDRAQAEYHGRNAIRISPRNARAHMLMGAIFTAINRNRAGEYHFRRALDLHSPNANIFMHLAQNMKNQGRMDESEEYYSKAYELNPKDPSILLGWITMEEARQNLEKAWQLLEELESLGQRQAAAALQRAILLGREKRFSEAIETLDNIGAHEEAVETDPTATFLLEKGRLYERLERYDDAWGCFEKAKAIVHKNEKFHYREKQATKLVKSLKSFFTSGRMELLPRANTLPGRPNPIFIVGFPRSGTTMVEQTLSRHSRITAGDELTFIGDLTRFMPRMLGSPMPYPLSLADLWLGDNQAALDDARNWYLNRVDQLGILDRDATWFTDKMPLNETNMGLISLIFPKSPIIHVVRHPLDVIVSVFSNYLTHGFFCAFQLTTIAQHYALIFDLIQHYRESVHPNYIAVKYEDIVADQETNVREILSFVGEDFEKECLDFHENTRYARTASYRQVTEKMYTTSVQRYSHYLDKLEPILPIVRPAIERLGYDI